MYKKAISSYDTKISALKNQPGSEAAIADYQRIRGKLSERLAAVPDDVAGKDETGQPTNYLARGLTRLFNSIEYQSAYPSVQRDMREQAYDKYVAPYWKKQGITPPDKDRFVDEIVREPEQPLGEALFGGAVEAARMTTKMGRAFVNAANTVVPYVLGARPSRDQSINKKLTDIINREDAYLGEHYANDARAQTIKGVGREAPGFVAWSLMAEGMGALGVGKISSAVWSRFAEKRVGDFATGFLTSKLEERDNKESAEIGGIAAGIGTAFDFLGKMGTWLGSKGATKRILDDAHLLQERSSGPIITPPPGEIIPPTQGLGAGPAQRGLPAAQSVQAPASPLPSQALLGTGVEGAKKPLDFISQANFRILNQATREVSNGRYKAFAMSPDSVRIAALKKVGYAFGEAVKDTVKNNPEFIQATAKASIEKQAAASPQFKQIIAETAKVAGKPEVNVALHVREMSEKEQVWAKVREMLKGLGPGAASAHERTVVESIKDLVRSNLKLQGHNNQITFAWSVRDALPLDVKTVVAKEMSDIYGKYPKKWDKAAMKLEEHIDKLIKTGHIKPVDMRGVFRSTNLTGNPTQWQDQLDQETKDLVNKMRQSGKKFGPGAASFDDPHFGSKYGTPEQPTANTQAATDWHQEALQRAREELGPNATLSEVLQRAAQIQKAGK